MTRGSDFFAFHEKVDWLVTNPPWSLAKQFLQHSYEVADNIVFLITLHHVFDLRSRIADMEGAGFAIKEVLLCQTPGRPWPQSGFQLGVVHLQRSYRGTIAWGWLDDQNGAGAAGSNPSFDPNIRPQQMSEPACKLIVGDSALKLKELAADSIDLTVTSPPYDGLRTYGTVTPETINHTVIHNRQRPAERAFNYTFDFEIIARELYRLTKPGGVVVWIVADQTRDYSESGTSFRQVLFFKEIGFNLYDTMIYESHKPPYTHRRYQQTFEFMFVLSKGRLNAFNPIMIPCTNAGQTPKRRTVRNTDGQLGGFRQPKAVKAMRIKGNIWTYDTGATAGEDKIAHLHPAIFPEKLAEDHILSWSNVGDVVLDPFLGSGTTGKMALKNGRRFIGIDISAEYVELARKRIGLAASIVTASPSEGEPSPRSAPQPPTRKLRLIRHIIIIEHFLPKITQAQY